MPACHPHQRAPRCAKLTRNTPHNTQRTRPTDIYGPRFGISLCIGLTAPAVYCIALCDSAIGFIISRLFIGFSLAVFVACQFWCTSMFTGRIVGAANAVAAGWGNMGGGFTSFIM